MSDALEVKELVVSYGGAPVIEGLSVTLFPGMFVGLLGPNGAGKTTMLLAISGQFRPASGSICYAGKNIYQENLWFKRRIGYVHETPFLYPDLTVEDFIRFVAGVKKIPTEKLDSEVAELLEKLLLHPERRKLTSNISLGMRKKVAIAAALLGRPEIVFLDEALNGVDFESTFHIKALLKEFVAEGGIVILSTHVLEVVERLCDRNLVLKDGQLIADLSADDLAKLKSEEASLEGYLVGLLNSLS
ncbi:MAG: ABC transporter ATP-binding protein [Candidatus Zixiibacteriota bacterium]